MKIEKKNNQDERKILIGLITDEVVLGRLSSIWSKDHFKSKWSGLVASWCFDFYGRYGKAPAANIEGIFEEWSKKSKDKDTVALVEKFLSGLSDEYETLKKGSNSDYIIDKAAKHFNTVQLEKLARSIKANIDAGEVEEASKAVYGFGEVEIGANTGIDVLQDKEALKQAFAEENNEIISYPGSLGKFFNGIFERDSLVAFMGPEKRGKTYWLMDVAWMALKQRRNVAFFSVGDMSQKQMLRRVAARAAGLPSKKLQREDKIRIPISLKRDEETREVKVRFKRRKVKNVVTWKQAWDAFQRIQKLVVKSKTPKLKLFTAPNDTLSVRGIETIIKKWEREGWVPDVVVIDYADILAMPDGSDDRGKINNTWKRLRTLSQTLHCCVVTATQTDANSYGQELLTSRNFSEDKRKFAHMTGCLGLNQTEAEKEKQVMRLNFIVRREGEYSQRRCCYVANCLALSRPVVLSCF